MKTIIYPQPDGSVRLDDVEEGSVLSSTTYPAGCYDGGEALAGWAKRQRPHSESVEIVSAAAEEEEVIAEAPQKPKGKGGKKS